jgi:hypothetical protein
MRMQELPPFAEKAAILREGGVRIGRGQCVEQYGAASPACRCWKP